MGDARHRLNTVTADSADLCLGRGRWKTGSNLLSCLSHGKIKSLRESDLVLLYKSVGVVCLWIEGEATLLCMGSTCLSVCLSVS